jgi:hypothetical protein
MLAAVLILALLALMVTTGIDLALNSYENMTAESETQLLLSTVTNVLTDELRYARDVSADGTTGELLEYTSVTYGRYTALTLEDGQLMVKESAGNKRVLSTGAYGNGAYAISDLAITYRAGVFHVDLTVTGTEGISAQTNLDIQCLNAG